MWDPLERALNAHGVQTIAYDASGTGDSPSRLVPLRMPGLARQAAHVLAPSGAPTPTSSECTSGVPSPSS
jgi:hypothetical protein